MARCVLFPRIRCLSRSPGRDSQAAKVVSDELQTPKANGFTKGEATAGQAFTVGGDGEH
jgi:hypothetical protein